MVTGRLSEYEVEVVTKMRSENKGYNEIAKLLDCTKDRVKNYCMSHNMGGAKAREWNDPSGGFDVFIENLKRKTNGTTVYISGYNGCDSTVMIKCLLCDKEIEKNVQFVRRKREYKCPGCAEKKAHIKRIEREKQREERRLKEEYEKQQKKIDKQKKRIKELTAVCKECGIVFVGTSKGRKYCSKECLKRKSNRDSWYKKDERLRGNGGYDSSISLKKLAKRDKQTCKLCGELVNWDDYIKTTEGHFISGDSYPSIDHIIPVSKGGQHSWDNIQLAHRGCNSEKRDSLWCETETGQLSLYAAM